LRAGGVAERISRLAAAALGLLVLASLDDLLWRANDPVNPQALQHANAANMVLKTMSETFRIGATKYFDRGDKPRPELRKPDEFDTPGFQKALKEGDMSTVNAIMKGAKIPCRSQD
jgi:hypothetical protein